MLNLANFVRHGVLHHEIKLIEIKCRTTLEKVQVHDIKLLKKKNYKTKQI